MKKIEASVMKSNFINGKVNAYFFLFIFIISIPIQLIFDLNYWFFTVFSGFASLLSYILSKRKYHHSYIIFDETYLEFKNYFENHGKFKGLKYFNDTMTIALTGITVDYKDISSINYSNNLIHLKLKNGKNYELDIVYFGYKEIQEIKAEINKLKIHFYI